MAAKAVLFCCKRLRRGALFPAGGLDQGVACTWVKAMGTSASRSDVAQADWGSSPLHDLRAEDPTRRGNGIRLDRQLAQCFRVLQHGLLPPGRGTVQSCGGIGFEPVQNGWLSAALVEHDRHLGPADRGENETCLTEFGVERFEHAAGDEIARRLHSPQAAGRRPVGSPRAAATHR